MSLRRQTTIALFPHGFSAHLDAMSVMDQTVEDAIRDGVISDLLVPARNRQLRSEDRGTGLVAIFAGLPDVAASGYSALTTSIAVSS